MYKYILVRTHDSCQTIVERFETKAEAEIMQIVYERNDPESTYEIERIEPW